MPARGLPRAVGAQAIARARLHARNEAVEHVAVADRKPPALRLALARLVEETEQDRVRVPGVHGDAGAIVQKAHAKMRRRPSFDGRRIHHACRCRLRVHQPLRQCGTFQISSAYWRIVRSDENQPMLAVLMMARRVQSELSLHMPSTLRCALQ